MSRTVATPASHHKKDPTLTLFLGNGRIPNIYSQLANKDANARGSSSSDKCFRPLTTPTVERKRALDHYEKEDATDLVADSRRTKRSRDIIRKLL